MTETWPPDDTSDDAAQDDGTSDDAWVPDASDAGLDHDDFAPEVGSMPDARMDGGLGEVLFGEAEADQIDEFVRGAIDPDHGRQVARSILRRLGRHE